MHDGPFNARVDDFMVACRVVQANPDNNFGSGAGSVPARISGRWVNVFCKTPSDLPQILHVIAKISATFTHQAVELEVRTLAQRQPALQAFGEQTRHFSAVLHARAPP
jgi:hypothetical protein